MVEAAELLDELPRGSQIWIHVGGPQAVSQEWEALAAVELAIRGYAWSQADPNKRGNEPEPMPYPELHQKYRESSARKSGDRVAARARARKQQLLERQQLSDT